MTLPTTLEDSLPPPPRRWDGLSHDAGPDVARLFHRLLALIFLIAWLSLGVQVHLLIGREGLLPLADFVASLRAQPGLTFFDFPTLFWWVQSNGALTAGVIAGVVLSLVALAGQRPRLCFALSTALYLSYATACRLFLSFQWDNLLLECGLLACFLPARRPAPLVTFLFRVLLFKLYFESGIAKWQSPLHDWHDGSSMTFYYETAPLPTALGWWAHNLPVWWHHFESRATLFLELIVPLAIFGTRQMRLGAAALLTAFQVANAATANYGFFCYLSLALHVFLLDDRDVRHAVEWVRRWLPPRQRTAPSPVSLPVPQPLARGWRYLGGAGAALFIAMSLIEAHFHFHFTEPGPTLALLTPVAQVNQTWRLVNTYHLFAAITRERIEPEFQTLDSGRNQTDDDAWKPQHLRHKPGDVDRRPDFVAPHQPRVDFQLWFYGLSFERREPAYVAMLIERMCEAPAVVQPLFAGPLPPRPQAVRIAYWQYHFTRPADRRATGAWWTRDRIKTSRAVVCPH